MIQTLKSGLFSFLLWLIHRLYDFLEYVQGCRHQWKKTTNLTVDKISELDFDGKIPNHIAFVASSDGSDLNLLSTNIASLISWSSLLHVENITVYDVQGLLKDNKMLIEKKIRETLITVPKDGDISLKNGFTRPFFYMDNKSQLSKVKFLSSLDGRYGLVTILKDLAYEKNKSMDQSPITVEVIDAAVRERYDFPDPELAIVLHKTTCLFGYPPWQLRLTEIFNLPSKGLLRFDDFVNILIRYSKCDKRFGK